MTFSQRLFIFFSITALVSPAQFILDFYEKVRSPSSDGVTDCLALVLNPGTLFFFSLTLGVATLFEISDHPILKTKSNFFWAKVLCFIPILVFMLEYLRVRFGGNPPDRLYFAAQVCSAALVLGTAILAKTVIYLSENQEMDTQ